MCTPACLSFAESALSGEDVIGKDVLEVGARDFNGSLRLPVEALRPARYLAVDMLPGPGVDVVCKAEHLVDRLGPESFDVVISTEMLEHVQAWRPVISNLKRVLRPGGVLVVTTRSKGFPFHGCPGDFWRYETDDLRVIFGDFTIERLERDELSSPGVFLKARKATPFREADLGAYKLYSIIRGRRIVDVCSLDVLAMIVAASGWKGMNALLPSSVTDVIRKRAWPHRLKV